MKINRFFSAGFVLGLSFGGFFDGIVFHQILGWHHLICRTDTCQPLSIASLQRQNTEDGFFHLAVWFLSLTGVGLLFRTRGVGSGWSLVGAMLAGWGAFNFVEGMINHQILGLHHVRPGSPQEFVYDLLFLASGLILVVAGLIVYKRNARTADYDSRSESKNSRR